MNKAVLIGRLTKDPEVRYTQNGTAVATFTLAVDGRFAKKDSGQQTADFLPIVAWRKTAEFVNQYLSKGKKVAVVGAIQTRSYDAKDGTKRYVTEIAADEIEFVESKGNANGQNARPQQNTMPPEENYDEEIPF